MTSPYRRSKVARPRDVVSIFAAVRESAIAIAPLRRHSFVVDAPRNQVADALRNLRGPVLFASLRNLSYYEATVADDRFTLREVAFERNSFTPEVRGRITTIETGTKVVVWITPPVTTAVFMAMWLSGAAYALVSEAHAAAAGARIKLGIAVPALLLVFGVVLTTLGFSFPAGKVVTFLSELFRRVEARAAQRSIAAGGAPDEVHHVRPLDRT